MKTIIRGRSPNRAYIAKDDPETGERVLTEFSAGENGGPVRAESGGRHWVTELRWDGVGRFIDLIRNEYRRVEKNASDRRRRTMRKATKGEKEC